MLKRPPGDRLWITLPMVFLFAFECLTPWWILKGETPGRGPWGRPLFKLSGATLATACGWVLMGSLWYWKMGHYFNHPITPGVRARDLMVFFLAGLIIYGHSCMDRMLGYGLKFGDHFKHTHLGWIGGKMKE